jgi:O-antigen/teichoic acid export membrane protein
MSLFQIFSYFALLEAGIGTATIQAFYKHIINDDKDKISEIIVTSKRYYRNAGIIYFIGVIAVAFIYPFIGKSSIDFETIFVIVLLQGVSGVIAFVFRSSLLQLLKAEGKFYVITTVVFISGVLTNVVKIVVIIYFKNVVIMQTAYLLVTLLQMLIYTIYFRKRYKWVDYTKKPDMRLIPQKKSFFLHQITGLIFNSTSTIILSIFCGFAVASVYAIYSLVFVSLQGLIQTLRGNTAFILDHTYHENKEQFVKIFDIYNAIYVTLVTALFSIAYVLILPFITIYTSRVTDIIYYDKYLPFLFCIATILTVSRGTCIQLINVSGHAKKTINRAIIEAGINLIATLILVNIIGIYGVLIGAIIALLYRTNDMMIYANIRIIGRKPIKNYKTLLTNLALFTMVVFISPMLNLQMNSYTDILKYGIILTPVILICFYFISCTFNYPDYKDLFVVLRKWVNLHVPLKIH